MESQRQEEEAAKAQSRKQQEEEELRIKLEEERMRRSWEEKMKMLEVERDKEERRRESERREEEKRREAKKKEEEDMREILELERMKLDEVRRKVEEDKKRAEEKVKALELAAKKHEEEVQIRKEEEKRRAEIEDEQRIAETARRETERLQQQEKEQKKEEGLQEASVEVSTMQPRAETQGDQVSESVVVVTESGGCVVTAIVDNDVISGEWKWMDGAPTPADWLALYALNQPAHKKYLQYMYTKGGPNGQYSFKGVLPGHYEVRFFSNGGYVPVSRTAAMRVGPKCTLAVQNQGDNISVVYAVDPPQAPSKGDWIGLYEKSQRSNKKYISSVYGNVNGTAVLKTPKQPGAYEVRLFVAGAYYNDQARADFEVTDNDSVTVYPELVLAGGTITVGWIMRTVENSSSDWIGLFRVDEPNNSKYISSIYTNASPASSTSMNIPRDLPPGLYELRLFARAVGKYVTFKTSSPFVVSA